MLGIQDIGNCRKIRETQVFHYGQKVHTLLCSFFSRSKYIWWVHHSSSALLSRSQLWSCLSSCLMTMLWAKQQPWFAGFIASFFFFFKLLFCAVYKNVLANRSEFCPQQKILRIKFNLFIPGLWNNTLLQIRNMLSVSCSHVLRTIHM